jgi:hydroxymethylglutaryl-CoA reductase (NADPH)
MATRTQLLKSIKEQYLKTADIPELANRLRARSLEDHPLEVTLPPMKEIAAGGADFLRKALGKQGKALPIVTGQLPPVTDESHYARNIENYIGLCSIPVGVAGPLRVNGLNAQGDFLIPLATTEAALVASFHRGCKAITLGGGVSSACLIDKIGRAPIFIFKNLIDALMFGSWVVTQEEKIKTIAESTSRYAKLVDMNITLSGQDVVVFLEYSTGDASGQNMVTIASDAVGHWLAANTPVPMIKWYIESNMSGDKKATALSFIHTRGKRVTAEARIPKEICEGVLKAKPKELYDAWKISMVSSAQCGAIGSQSHYANGLTALFIATGQDAACTAEAAVGITEYAVEDDGSLVVNVCLPNLVLGTVGGGTSLPTQRECLELMGCYGHGKAAKLAEICAGMIMAGEISITAAIAAGHFAQAHKAMARGPGK